MSPATVLRTARERAGISKRELARRARTSPAAIVAYESGRRDPSFGTLDRLLRALGLRAELVAVPVSTPDRPTAARRLAEVLDLADRLPKRRAARRPSFPPFPRDDR
ncbi:MAG: hypothetical protein KatS3mg009_1094 [Acidimicrobiia bacterium]|nr:MAG: hypothetical protein KatS3mg009_1094 [Acidimicrobiia bacterium]